MYIYKFFRDRVFLFILSDTGYPQFAVPKGVEMEFATRLATFGILCALIGSAQATSKRGSAELRLDWDSGKNVNICSSAGGECVPLVMPDSVGDVKKVIVRKFFTGKGLSWLAISEDEVHLCILGKHSPSVACTPLAKKFRNLSLSVEETTYGQDLRWVINGKTTKEKKQKKLNSLITAFGQAQAVISQKTSAVSARSHLSETTDYVEDDGDGGDYGGGGSSGGGDDGGQVLPIEPPIPVVVVTGQLPTDPTEPALPNNPPTPDPSPVVVVIGNLLPEEAPWYCRYFNIACPDAPAVGGDPTPPPPPLPPYIPPYDPIPRYAEGYEQEISQCHEDNMNDMTECSAYFKALGYRTFGACKDRATANLVACQDKARADFAIP